MAYYHCLLFDVDGTLLDFKASQRKAIAETLPMFDLPADDETITLYGQINQELWAALERGEIRKEKLYKERFARLCKQLGQSRDAGEMSRAYERNLSQHADLMPGAIEMLRELSEVATLAVISNGTEKVQRSRLESSGIADFMDGFYVSERIGTTKPSRKFFDMALEGLGVEYQDKVLVIGDSLKADIEGGKNAGLATCWFDDSGEESEPRIKADYVIHDLKELYAIVMEEEELVNVGNQNRKHQN